MTDSNKEVLKRANDAITKGDHEGFLSFCTEDTKWIFLGDKILEGKEAVREWMKTAYAEPPVFMVENLIAEDDFVIAIGKIKTKNEDGKMILSSYCDVWKLRNGKLAELKAFVIETE